MTLSQISEKYRSIYNRHISEVGVQMHLKNLSVNKVEFASKKVEKANCKYTIRQAEENTFSNYLIKSQFTNLDKDKEITQVIKKKTKNPIISEYYGLHNIIQVSDKLDYETLIKSICELHHSTKKIDILKKLNRIIIKNE